MPFMTKWLPAMALILAFSAQAEIPEAAVWIDVRTPEEFAEGHIDDANLIPYEDIAAGVAQLGLDKDTPIFLYCRSGRRSEIARESLEKAGFSRVTNVGGLSDALKITGQEAPHMPQQ